MPARRRQRDPSALKTVRMRVQPRLTREEARELEARAAADFRSVGNYVAWLIAQHLGAKRKGCVNGLSRRYFGVRPQLKLDTHEGYWKPWLQGRGLLRSAAPEIEVVPRMSPQSLMLVTCVVCLRLHEPKNPVLINPVCGNCTKPKTKYPARPQ